MSKVKLTRLDQGERESAGERERRRSVMLAKVERWLEDQDTVVGVFENVDLSSTYVGSRVAFPYASANAPDLKVGVTQAPDNKAYGLGWRYRLKLVTTDPHLAVSLVMRDDVAAKQMGV